MFLGTVSVIFTSVLVVYGADPGCTVDGKTFKVGEQHDIPGSCHLNVCQGNDEWAVAACGAVGGPARWKFVPEDPSKPFPACCGYVVPPHDIVPDVIDKLQSNEILDITYDDTHKVDLGNELTPTQVKNQPQVTYPADPMAWYTLCMIDPDAPSRQDPKLREFQHWLVGNIPGNNVTAGEVLSEYVGSGPPKGTGLHRYVFVVYKQPNKLTFDEPRLTSTSADNRGMFSVRKFAQKYNLGDPIAFNLYQAQYDDYVPQVHKQLGLQLD